jgi:hypothetical protein
MILIANNNCNFLKQLFTCQNTHNLFIEKKTIYLSSNFNSYLISKSVIHSVNKINRMLKIEEDINRDMNIVLIENFI